MSSRILSIIGSCILILFLHCSAPRIVIMESYEDLQAAIDNDPNNYVNYYNMGLKHLSEKKYSEAIEYFRQSLEFKPNFALAHFAIYCTEYARDPNLYREALKDELSEESILKIREIDEHLDYAFMLDPFFDWRVATILVDSRPAMLDPVIEKIYDLLIEGFRKFMFGQYQLAVADLTKSIEVFPEYIQARFFRGLAFAQLEDYDNAIADFQTIINDYEELNKSKILPIFFNPSELYYLIGYSYLQKGDINKAEIAFQSVLENHFGFYMAHFQLSNIYQQKRQYDRVLEGLNAALLIEPNDPIMHFNKGVWLTALGRVQEAIESYSAAVSLNGNYFQAYYNMALIFDENGNTIAAIDNYKKFIATTTRGNELYVKRAEERIYILRNSYFNQ